MHTLYLITTKCEDGRMYWMGSAQAGCWTFDRNEAMHFDSCDAADKIASYINRYKPAWRTRANIMEISQ